MPSQAFTRINPSGTTKTLSIAGKIADMWDGVSINVTKVKEPKYGAGSKPHYIATGQESYSGSFSLSEDEAGRFNAEAPGGHLINAEFTLILLCNDPVHIGNVLQGKTYPRIAHKLEGVQITSESATHNVGDTSTMITYEFLAVRYSVAIA